MMNARFQRVARRHRAIAIALTLFFHMLLIAAIAYASDSEISALLPEPLQEWIGLTPAQPDQPLENTAPAPTP